ncbi:MAG: hypothetical protein Q9218_004779 [Villophora microphyllina]
MLSTNSAGKSILKSSSSISKDSPRPPTLSRDERNRQVALHHARLLQDRKDIESEILISTEKLLDLPSSNNASSSEPSAEDTATVKEALRPFQPSDYDALIEERNINRHCGYILCPSQNRSQNTNGKYRIITGKKSNLKVVETKDLERWCSNDCGRKAMYLRVQLSTKPAWTRDCIAGDPLKLYDERDICEAGGPNRNGAVSQPLDTGEESKSRMKDLAVERGDRDKIDKVSTKVAIRVKENLPELQDVPVPPSTQDNHGGSIEGYVPMGKDAPKPTTGRGKDEDDLMSTI